MKKQFTKLWTSSFSMITMFRRNKDHLQPHINNGLSTEILAYLSKISRNTRNNMRRERIKGNSVKRGCTWRSLWYINGHEGLSVFPQIYNGSIGLKLSLGWNGSLWRNESLGWNASFVWNRSLVWNDQSNQCSISHVDFFERWA